MTKRLALACGSLLVASSAFAQSNGWDPIAVSTELRDLRSQASNPDEAMEAVLALSAILETLDAQRNPSGELREVESELYHRALEYRARAQLARGERQEAADDLRLLILADPGWRLDLTELAPAVVDLYEEQRSELVAFLTVRTEPPGVTVLLAGEPVGQTPLVGQPVLAGFVAIELERAGFASLRESRRDVFAGEVIEIEHEMERRGPALSVITSPAGVTVRVGGRVVGSTDGDLPEDLRPLVPPRYAGEEFSSPLDLGGLSLGANEITLEAPCRRPARFTFHADEARDYLPRFVRLRPSTGGLRVESEPSGGRVLLDGEERGVTPVSFSAMCAGEHRVEIRHASGRCARSFTVSRGSRTAVHCDLLPVLSLAPSNSPDTGGAEELVRRQLEAREEFHLLDAANGEDIQAKLRVVAPEAGGGSARVEFLADGSRKPDSASFDRFAPETASQAVEELLSLPMRSKPWLGLTVAIRGAGSEDGSGLQVVSVHPAGPAVLAGIEPGDQIVAVEGTPVSHELALDEIVEGFAPGATVDVLVRRAGADRPLRLTLAETPVLPSLGGERCNRRLVELQSEFARGQRDPLRQLEAGICWILLGDPGRALIEHLGDLEIPAGPGIGAGTALYYRGLALAAVSEPVRAGEAFQAAAAVPGATLVTHDGPLLAPLARWRGGTPR